MALALSENRAGVVVDILVSPRAHREAIGPVVGDRLKIAVAAPPVDGEANDAVVRLLAKALKIPRSAVRIVRGESGRRKTIALEGVSAARLLEICST